MLKLASLADCTRRRCPLAVIRPSKSSIGTCITPKSMSCQALSREIPRATELSAHLITTTRIHRSPIHTEEHRELPTTILTGRIIHNAFVSIVYRH